MNVQWIFNQCVVNSKRYIRDEPNGPYYPFGRVSWDDLLAASQNNFRKEKILGLSTPWADSIGMIDLQTVKRNVRDETNKIYCFLVRLYWYDFIEASKKISIRDEHNKP